MHRDTEAALRALPLEIVHQLEQWAGTQVFDGSQSIEGTRTIKADRRLLWAGPGRLMGWSVEGVAAGTKVYLRDSRDAAGDPIAVLKVTNAGDVTNHNFSLPGLGFEEGLYCDVVVGQAVGNPGASLVGSFHLGAVD